MSAPLLELRGVRKSYGEVDGRPVDVLRGIDVRIEAGEFVAIVGASGSGKSTLMNILGALDRPSAGQYLVEGRDVAGLGADERARLRRETFGFIFQQYHLIPGASVLDNVEMPAIYAGASAADRRERAIGLLERLGLGDRLGHRPAQLSGGQQQRVSIARALMNGGRVILADEPTGALDRQSGQQVMALLRELADQGHTIILITHDPQVAALADRVIEVDDGQVVRDERRPGPRRAAAAIERGAAHGHDASLAAALAEALKAASRTLRANPARTALTLLGIIIGVAAVVALLAIGEGARRQVFERLSALGTNIIYMSGDEESLGLPGSPVTLEDVAAVRELPDVLDIMPVISGNATIRFGNRHDTFYTLGVTTSLPSLHHWPVAQGRFFDEADDLRMAAVVVLGMKVLAKLFPDGGDPIGAYVLIDNVPFQVIGVLAPKGAASGREDLDDQVVMPYRTASARIYGRPEPTYVVMAAREVARVDRTEAAITALMDARHGRRDFYIASVSSQIRVQVETQRTMGMLLAAVAAISLLIGGIGVMNIMLMTVRERRREIGIRAAAGARASDILRQFLAEATLLSGLGGLVGLLAGLLLALVPVLFGMPVVFSLRAAAAALACAVVTGMAFGYLPARQATRLDPVAALAST